MIFFLKYMYISKTWLTCMSLWWYSSGISITNPSSLYWRQTIVNCSRVGSHLKKTSTLNNKFLHGLTHLNLNDKLKKLCTVVYIYIIKQSYEALPENILFCKIIKKTKCYNLFQDSSTFCQIHKEYYCGTQKGVLCWMWRKC